MKHSPLPQNFHPSPWECFSKQVAEEISFILEKKELRERVNHWSLSAITKKSRSVPSPKEESGFLYKHFKIQKQETLNSIGGFRIEAAGSPMSILSSNCQGAGSVETIRFLRALRRKHYLDFIFLMDETEVRVHSWIKETVGL